jgi:peptide/nickel transport system ATP-binding protein
MSADPAAGSATGRAGGQALDRATHHAISAAGSSLSDAADPVSGPVLDIRDLSIVYRTPAGDVRAVDDVNLTLGAGEVVGLAGESGSGKSTLAYGACRLLRAPALVTNGSVTYRGRRVSRPADILKMRPDELRRLRWREIAIVFQSAMNALNPVLNVRDQLLDVIHAP